MKFQVSQEEMQVLADVYNSLLTVHTKGSDTFVMADCMRTLERTIRTISANDHQIIEEQEEE